MLALSKTDRRRIMFEFIQKNKLNIIYFVNA